MTYTCRETMEFNYQILEFQEDSFDTKMQIFLVIAMQISIEIANEFAFICCLRIYGYS